MTTTSAPESVTDWLDLRDRVAVVTGAAGGIGAASRSSWRVTECVWQCSI